MLSICLLIASHLEMLQILLEVEREEENEIANEMRDIEVSTMHRGKKVHPMGPCIILVGDEHV